MPNLYNYLDFRAYLADYYEEQKAAKPHFSYRFFSNRIGFKSKDFIYRVINCGGRLSPKSIFKVSTALGHDARERRYFENLVRMGQARTNDEREYYFDLLSGDYRSTAGRQTPAQRMAQRHLELFSDWYCMAVHALIDIAEFTDDYEWLGKQVRPRISARQAKKAVKRLDELGLIRRDDDGVWRVVQKSLETGPDVMSISLVRYYKACTQLAAEAIEKLPRSVRHSSGVTVGISERSYRLITEAIDRFRAEIARIAADEEQPDRVYQLHVNLFPLSQVGREQGEHYP
jgi:uncharacterized protein (TIGR02147 family)